MYGHVIGAGFTAFGLGILLYGGPIPTVVKYHAILPSSVKVQDVKKRGAR